MGHCLTYLILGGSRFRTRRIVHGLFFFVFFWQKKYLEGYEWGWSQGPRRADPHVGCKQTSPSQTAYRGKQNNSDGLGEMVISRMKSSLWRVFYGHILAHGMWSPCWSVGWYMGGIWGQQGYRWVTWHPLCPTEVAAPARMLTLSPCLVVSSEGVRYGGWMSQVGGYWRKGELFVLGVGNLETGGETPSLWHYFILFEGMEYVVYLIKMFSSIYILLRFPDIASNFETYPEIPADF